VAESFFQLLRRERVKRKIYSAREEARRDILDYIQIFYNSKLRYGFNGQLPSIEYEKR
jgi:putative transposase